MAERVAPEKSGYQGWKNHETWGVALWIDNERSLYEERRYMTRERWSAARSHENVPAVWTRSQAAQFTLAESLKEWVEEMAPELGATLYSDLMSWALAEVDWDELADSWLNEEVNENGDGGYEVKK